MIKTNIKMIVNPEQSKIVQEICFENGVYWRNGSRNYEDANNICINQVEKYLFTYISEIDFEKCQDIIQVDSDLFIRTNGSCEEKKVEYNGQILTDMSEWQNDRESGLYYENIQLKKKIENLHIALNKKNEKNKKRALEISRLLKQKEELKKRVDSKHLDIQICLLEKFELHKKIKSNKQSIEILANQIASNAIDFKKQLEEKDTNIKYLEDRLIEKQGERK